MKEEFEMNPIANKFEQDSATFDARFWRCHSMLRLIAYRVLGNCERAEIAIRNCWLTASHYAPRFDSEGAFRSWLLRVLIDEALALVTREPARSHAGSIAQTNSRRLFS